MSFVCDLRADRLQAARLEHRSLKTTKSYAEVLGDQQTAAVAIATPMSSHFELAMAALKAGKHVLVEKPLAPSSEECRLLIQEAERRGLTLMVDHTFIYTGAVRKIKELISTNQLGRLYYYDSVRVNLGLYQHDVNVLWDLAVHDLAILDHLLGRAPEAVCATGIAHLPDGQEDVCYLTCFFSDSLIAHFHVNWLAPVKIRRTLIGGDRQMIVYDDLEADEKVKVYNKGIAVRGKDPIVQQLVSYRVGDMWAPRLDRDEALQMEARHFLDCIATGVRPLTDGASALRIVSTLEAAERSLRHDGRRIQINLPATDGKGAAAR